MICLRAKLLYAATVVVSAVHCYKELQHVHGAAHWRLQRWAEETVHSSLVAVERAQQEQGDHQPLHQ